MKKMIRFIPVWVLLSATVVSAAVVPHIGFVYPAGATPGETVTVTIGGQYLRDFADINLSGIPVKVAKTDYLRVYDRKEANAIRRGKEVLEAKLAEETSEPRKEMMQQQIDLFEQEAVMLREVAREDKMNPAMAAKKQFNPQIAERVTLEITLPANVKPGDYELRVITTNGLSNPLLFQVGQLPEVSESEPNNQITAPQKLPALPVLVNGQIMPGDVDCFRLHATKGQTLVFQAEARALVPYLADAVPGWFQSVLTLYDAKGKQVAYDDDYLFNPDPVLIYNVPADGDYTLSIRDSIYRGREDFVYRLSIGELPFIERIFPLGGSENSDVEVSLYGVNLPGKKLRLQTAGNAPETQHIHVEKNGLVSNSRAFSVSPLPDMKEAEPNDSFSQAVAVTNDAVINGTIGKPGDQDWFCFKGDKGDTKTIEVHARRLGSPLDARLILMDAQQKVISTSDDVEDKSEGLMTHHADARIDFKLPERGTYFVRLDDVQGKGGDEYAYRLMIGDEQPDYQLRVAPSSLRIPRNGTAIVAVHAIRYGGFNGKIELSVLDAPSGISLQRAVIPEGTNLAQVVISASPRSEKQMMELQIEGTADCGAHSVTRRAVPSEDMMQAFIYRHLVTAQKLLVQISEPNPVTVTLNLPADGIIRARPGSEVSLSAIVNRKSDGAGGVKLALSDAPEWLTLATDTIGLKTGNEIILKISPNAEPGDTATVLLNGTARVGKFSKDSLPTPKFLSDNKTVDFTIDAIPIQIIQ